jgi:hypothetical protein
MSETKKQPLAEAVLRELVELDWALAAARRANKVEEEATLEYQVVNKVIANLSGILDAVVYVETLLEMLSAVPDNNINGYQHWKDMRRLLLGSFKLPVAEE